MEIIIKNLKKNYGKKTVLDNINLRITEGMYGLLGANGAGKTTLIRILSTLIQKTDGDVILDGIPIENINMIKKYVGYMPQEFGFYPNFTVYEILDYFSVLSNIEHNKDENIVDLLSSVNLSELKKVKVKALSGGMKRRLGIAVAMINNPKLLLVDEPTVGLDPQERMNFRKLLAKYSDGRIVILSTHIISDIEEICENLAVMKSGRILYLGSSNDFRNKTKGEVWEVVTTKEVFKSFQSDFESKFEIISQNLENDKIKLRLLSSEKPCNEAVMVDSRIEDSYIKIINNK